MIEKRYFIKLCYSLTNWNRGYYVWVNVQQYLNLSFNIQDRCSVPAYWCFGSYINNYIELIYLESKSLKQMAQTLVDCLVKQRQY